MEVQTDGETRVDATSLGSIEGDIKAEVLVLGSGPGGYTVVFLAADLDKKNSIGRTPPLP